MAALCLQSCPWFSWAGSQGAAKASSMVLLASSVDDIQHTQEKVHSCAKWQVLQAVGYCVGHANLSNVSRMNRGVTVSLKELCG